jgi:peptidoglycan hydrolase-like protein with peptidoglycan-binding domain
MKIVKSAAAVIATSVLLAGTAMAQTSTPSGPATPPTGDVKEKQRQGAAPATPEQRTRGVTDPGAKEQAKDPVKEPTGKSGMPDTKMGEKADRMGMASTEQVRQAQQALKEKGQYEGAVDGVIGPKTQAALKSYQQAEGLKATGRLDAQTMAKLGVSDASSPSAAPGPPAVDADKEKRGGDTQTMPPGRKKQNP